ncbi:MAG: hypothetical protein NNA20_04440 [Nitrospira sp.]|nr:hypothetical protein [Nitrospira sp.]MCP9441820.1 hypothetical protein [Nitrospira sp.]
MSWGYWGIVGALVIMVGLTLACVTFLASPKREEFPPNGEATKGAGTSIRHLADGHRQAA